MIQNIIMRLKDNLSEINDVNFGEFLAFDHFHSPETAISGLDQDFSQMAEVRKFNILL